MVGLPCIQVKGVKARARVGKMCCRRITEKCEKNQEPGQEGDKQGLGRKKVWIFLL